MFTVGGAPKQGRGTPYMILRTIFFGETFVFVSVSNGLSEKNGT